MTEDQSSMHHGLSELVEEAGLNGKPIDVLEEKFESVEAVVAYLENGNSLSDLPGIGDTTSSKVMWWFEDNHPEAHRRRKENDESIWTDFETKEGSCGSESVDGNPVWGAYCPQEDCGQLNFFEGDPDGFAGRPYACQSCNWVSLMDRSVRNLEVDA